MQRKIVLLSNCILNGNTQSSKELVKFFTDSNIGIVQLPCPKFRFESNVDDKKKCSKLYRNYCKELSTKVMCDVEKYAKTECDVLGIVGIEFSANCGVNKFSNGKKGWGKGIFFEELEKQMEVKKMQIPFLGADMNNVFSTMRKFQVLVNNS